MFFVHVDIVNCTLLSSIHNDRMPLCDEIGENRAEATYSQDTYWLSYIINILQGYILLIYYDKNMLDEHLVNLYSHQSRHRLLFLN